MRLQLVPGLEWPRLLLINGGGRDQLVPPSAVEANYRRYDESPPLTDPHIFPDRYT